MCRKASLCCPITFVEVCHDINVIVYGVAQSLAIYSTNGHMVSKISLVDVFGSHSTCGCTYNNGDNDIMVYGWKYVASVSLTSPSLGTINFRSSEMQDLILDCRKARINDRNLCLIGYAQNIIELIDMKSGESLCEFKSPVVCVLFSLSILPTMGDEITIASGTAFGPIHVWKVHMSLSADGQVFGFDSYRAVSTLRGHTGVIFRLRWGATGRWIASTSDDRSVRVWDTLSRPSDGESRCVFVGWGHQCRVWDVLFVGQEEAYLLTCSEDASIKLWRWQHQQHISGDSDTDWCVCTMRGHSKHIWRLALLHGTALSTQLLPDTLTDPRPASLLRTIQQLQHITVLSAGNDGDVKLWPLSMHCVVSGHGVTSLTQSFHVESPHCATPPPPFYLHCPLPNWRHDSCVCRDDLLARLHIADAHQEGSLPRSLPHHNTSSKGSRRDHGAAGLFLCPRGGLCVIALLEGGLWLVDLTASLSSEGEGWVCVATCGRGSGVTSAAVQWEEGEGGDGWRVCVACTHPDETVTVTKLIVSTGNHVPASGVAVVVEGQDVWHTAGMGKGVNVWLGRSEEGNTIHIWSACSHRVPHHSLFCICCMQGLWMCWSRELEGLVDCGTFLAPPPRLCGWQIWNRLGGTLSLQLYSSLAPVASTRVPVLSEWCWETVEAILL